jgi:hypothetical protein
MAITINTQPQNTQTIIGNTYELSVDAVSDVTSGCLVGTTFLNSDINNIESGDSNTISVPVYTDFISDGNSVYAKATAKGFKHITNTSTYQDLISFFTTGGSEIAVQYKNDSTPGGAQYRVIFGVNTSETIRRADYWNSDLYYIEAVVEGTCVLDDISGSITLTTKLVSDDSIIDEISVSGYRDTDWGGVQFVSTLTNPDPNHFQVDFIGQGLPYVCTDGCEIGTNFTGRGTGYTAFSLGEMTNTTGSVTEVGDGELLVAGLSTTEYVFPSVSSANATRVVARATRTNGMNYGIWGFRNGTTQIAWIQANNDRILFRVQDGGNFIILSDSSYTSTDMEFEIDWDVQNSIMYFRVLNLGIVHSFPQGGTIDRIRFASDSYNNASARYTANSIYVVADNQETACFGLPNEEPTYQWKKDSVDINGETSSTLSISNLDADDLGDYTVAVTDSGGTVLSSVATLSKASTINITSPATLNSYIGGDVTISPTISTIIPVSGCEIGKTFESTVYNPFAGDPSFVNISNLAGFTAEGNDIKSTVWIKNFQVSGGSTSYRTVFEFFDRAELNLQFVTNTAFNPTSAKFRMAGTEETTFRSLYVNTPMTAKCELIGSSPSDYFFSGTYRVTLYDSSMSVVDILEKTIVSQNIGLVKTLIFSSAFDVLPTEFSVEFVGQGFANNCTGIVGELSYQWKKDSVDINGETANDLSLTDLTINDFDTYTVSVSDGWNTTESNIIEIVQVVDTLTINSDPIDATVATGDTVVFDVDATTITDNIITYQWQKDDVNIVGATTESLILTGVDFDDDGVYKVIVTDENEVEHSSTATLTVFSTLEVSDIDEISLFDGDTLETSITVTGGSNAYAYSWLLNGSPIGGNTNSITTPVDLSNNNNTLVCNIDDGYTIASTNIVILSVVTFNLKAAYRLSTNDSEYRARIYLDNIDLDELDWKNITDNQIIDGIGIRLYSYLAYIDKSIPHETDYSFSTFPLDENVNLVVRIKSISVNILSNPDNKGSYVEYIGEVTNTNNNISDTGGSFVDTNIEWECVRILTQQ